MNDNEFRGAKYDKSLTRTQIAALVRSDVKAAIKAGVLPAGLKVSVRCNGSAITASITAFPAAVLNPARVYADAIGVWEQRTRLLYTAPVRQAVDAIEALLNAYLRDASDIQTDYFNCNFYGSVDVRTDNTAERERLLASDELSDLRVSKAAKLDLVPYLDAYDSAGGFSRIDGGWSMGVAA